MSLSMWFRIPYLLLLFRRREREVGRGETKGEEERGEVWEEDNCGRWKNRKLDMPTWVHHMTGKTNEIANYTPTTQMSPTVHTVKSLGEVILRVYLWEHGVCNPSSFTYQIVRLFLSFICDALGMHSEDVVLYP